MRAGYVTKGAAYMFHSAALMPNEPRRDAMSAARLASLASPGEQVRDCTAASAVGCQLPRGGPAAGSADGWGEAAAAPR